MSYNNPILIEQYAELFFTPSSITPSNIFDIVPKIKNEGYPQVEMVQIDQLTVEGISQKETVISPSQIPRVRCWNGSKTNLIQLSPDLVVVNKVGKYFGWHDFLSLFNTAFKAIEEYSLHSNIRSIAFNTIDSIKVPLDGFTVGKYLNCGGEKIPAWYRDTTESFDVSLGKGFLNIDNHNRQVRIIGRKLDSEFEIKIHAVFHDVCQNIVPLEILDKLHNESNDSFESMITDITRNDVMGGVKK